jgi:hypothetical protein
VTSGISPIIIVLSEEQLATIFSVGCIQASLTLNLFLSKMKILCYLFEITDP